MLIARLPTAAAGCMRLGPSLRTLHTPSLRAGAPSPSRILPLALSGLRQQASVTCPPTALGLRLKSSSSTPRSSSSTPRTSTKIDLPPTSSLVSSQIPDTQWPWRVVENPPEGTEEIERIIYARSTGQGAKMTWAMIILMLTATVSYIIIPSPKEAVAAGHLPDENSRDILGLSQEVFFTFAVTGAATVFLTFGLLSLGAQSRIIERMALVRQKPIGAPASSIREFIRFSTASTRLLARNRPRELPVDKVNPYLIIGKPLKSGLLPRSPWVSVSLDTPRYEWAPVFSWDHMPYRLDFRETAALDKQEGEIIMSLQRLEDVFGELQSKHEGRKAADITRAK